MLSVGAGPAYLEKLIVRRFGVEKESIELADFPKAVLPGEFVSHRFDMHEEWPSFSEPFDFTGR